MSDGKKWFQPTAPKYLTAIAHGSAPFIVTFLLIHLSAPALANLGGSSLASKTMLLGREYYQTPLGEKTLVLAPLSIHILAGIAKRLLSPKPRDEPRRFSSPLSVTGYASALLFLPIHYLSHRVDPALDAEPIFAVGPSELDYEFVKVGIQKWPVRSWLLYGGLVFFTALHLADGLGVIWNTWLKEGLKNTWIKNSKIRRRLALGGIVLPVLTGIYAISREPLMTLASTAKRYSASFTTSFVYRI